MKDFDLRRFLIEDRLTSNDRFDINENEIEEKDDFGFFFPPLKGGVSDKEKAEAILDKNGIDYTDGGMFVIDFKGKNYKWKDIMSLLHDNGIYSSQTYTYR